MYMDDERNRTLGELISNNSKGLSTQISQSKMDDNYGMSRTITRNNGIDNITLDSKDMLTKNKRGKSAQNIGRTSKNRYSKDGFTSKNSKVSKSTAIAPGYINHTNANSQFTTNVLMNNRGQHNRNISQRLRSAYPGKANIRGGDLVQHVLHSTKNVDSI